MTVAELIRALQNQPDRTARVGFRLSQHTNRFHEIHAVQKRPVRPRSVAIPLPDYLPPLAAQTDESVTVLLDYVPVCIPKKRART